MNRRKIVRPWLLIILINILGYSLLSINKAALSDQILKIGATVTFVLMLSYFMVNKMSHMTDNYIFLIVSMLFSVGEIMLLRLDLDFARKQMVWLLISIAVFFISYILVNKLNIWDKVGFAYFYVAIALFIITLIAGKTQGGSRNWIIIGPLSFQPSEIIKLLAVFMLADRYANEDRYKIKGINPSIVSSAMIYVFLGFLVIQREWGTAVLLVALHITMMYIYGTDIKVMLLNIICGGAGAILGALFVPHIKVRISVWLDPWSQIWDKGNQIAQSLFAITAGGFFGTGLGLGSPEYIPEVHSDFIFSAICEEFGILGGVGIVLLYLLLVYRGIRISMKIEDEFYRCVATGISIILGVQTFIILGGVIKMIPLTGITLPFISYGGSSLLTCFMAIGILEACANKVVPKIKGEVAENEEEQS